MQSVYDSKTSVVFPVHCFLHNISRIFFYHCNNQTFSKKKLFGFFYAIQLTNIYYSEFQSFWRFRHETNLFISFETLSWQLLNCTTQSNICYKQYFTWFGFCFFSSFAHQFRMIRMMLKNKIENTISVWSHVVYKRKNIEPEKMLICLNIMNHRDVIALFWSWHKLRYTYDCFAMQHYVKWKYQYGVSVFLINDKNLKHYIELNK